MSSSEELVLAIDGGGTRTRYLLAGVDGRMLARVDAAATNYRKTNLQAVAEELASGFQILVKSSGLIAEPALVQVCAGFAGVDTREDACLLTGTLAEVLRVPPDFVQVVNDGEIALEAALQGRPGLLVISGTGSIVWAAGPNGRHHRVGGWDYVLGDEGSGYDIGLRALRCCAALQDGRVMHSILPSLVLKQLRLASFEKLLEAAYADSLQPHIIASLTASVEAAAAQGDPSAHQILETAARELVTLVAAAARKALLLGTRFEVVPMGGALLGGAAFVAKFAEQMQSALPGAHMTAARSSALDGALQMALRKTHKRTMVAPE